LILERRVFATEVRIASDATVIGKLMWHGFCSAAVYVRLDSFLRRCVKLGYVGLQLLLVMFLEADDALFRKILYNKTNVLYMYLPDRPEIVYSLRTRTP